HLIKTDTGMCSDFVKMYADLFSKTVHFFSIITRDSIFCLPFPSVPFFKTSVIVVHMDSLITMLYCPFDGIQNTCNFSRYIPQIIIRINRRAFCSSMDYFIINDKHRSEACLVNTLIVAAVYVAYKLAIR